MKEYGISARLTFSNSLLRTEHLSDKKCNDLCSYVWRKEWNTKWCNNSFRFAIRVFKK